MATATSKSPIELTDIWAEARTELDRVPDGFVEIRIYKSNHALENHDITTHRRNKGRINADLATN